MSRFIYLFCEGNSDSLDRALLKKVTHAIPNVSIQPLGGKRGLGNYTEGFRQGLKPFIQSLGTIPDDLFVVFRDRDFDFPVPASPRLIGLGNNTYAGHLTTIENYLLNPDTLFEYISENGSPSDQLKIPTINSAKEFFHTAFKDLRYYTAARWAHGNTKERNASLFSLYSNWPYESGALPTKISDTDCRVILSDIIDKIRQKSDGLDFGIFEEEYSKFLNKFDDTFMQDISQCLVWFNGKDIASILHRLLGGNSFFLNGRKDYYEFALSKIDINSFPDLVELRNIINGTTPLEPLTT